MKVFYFNDRSYKYRVYVNGTHFENSILFKPHEAKVIEFPAPEGAVAYIKEWDGQTMVSWSKVEDLPNEVKTVSVS